MNNISTDLLRSLVAVVDHRSFTRAASALGLTQPAVSAHVKRLEAQLGTDLFDRSAPGILLTPKGDNVVRYARRMLSLNDQIAGLDDGDAAQQVINIGLPDGLPGGILPWCLASFRNRWPGYTFNIVTTEISTFDNGLRDELDLGLILSQTPIIDARHQWQDQLVWVRSDATVIDRAAPVPLVAYDDFCISFQIAAKALADSGRDYRVVMNSRNVLALCAGVDSGLGTLVTTRRGVELTSLRAWDDAPLPALPVLHHAIYVREGHNREVATDLADAFADMIMPKPAQNPAAFPSFKIVSTDFGHATLLPT